MGRLKPVVTANRELISQMNMEVGESMVCLISSEQCVIGDCN